MSRTEACVEGRPELVLADEDVDVLADLLVAAALEREQERTG